MFSTENGSVFLYNTFGKTASHLHVLMTTLVLNNWARLFKALLA